MSDTNMFFKRFLCFDVCCESKAIAIAANVVKVHAGNYGPSDFVIRIPGLLSVQNVVFQPPEVLRGLPRELFVGIEMDHYLSGIIVSNGQLDFF